ncbi:MAG: mechanosensitive ion channel family protein [Terriglobia bacterium]
MGELLFRSLTTSFTSLMGMVAHFLPRLVAMVITIVIGFIVAWILKVIIRRILLFFRFDQVSETAGFTQMLAKAAMPSPAQIISSLVFWVVWISFVLFGLNALQITPLQEEISRFFFFLPQIFVAVLILFVGVLIANFFGRATLLAAVNANAPMPRLLSSVVRFLIIAIAVTMALERIGLGRGVVVIAFTIAFGAVMLGLALAFGLGGRDAARRLLEKKFLESRKTKEEEEDDISHL